MPADSTFVRRCQAKDCPTVFGAGERVCRLCGRHRAQRCWEIAIVGADEEQLEQIETILDIHFNSDRFVGRITGIVLRAEAVQWEAKNIEIHRDNSGRVEDGTQTLIAAFEKSGFTLGANLGAKR